jgi:hypothetical protein
MRRLAHQPQFGAVETDSSGDDVVVGKIVIANLTAGTATQNMRVRKHCPEFVITFAACQRPAPTKVENEIGVSSASRNRAPTGGLVPGELIYAHRNTQVVAAKSRT